MPIQYGGGGGGGGNGYAQMAPSGGGGGQTYQPHYDPRGDYGRQLGQQDNGRRGSSGDVNLSVVVNQPGMQRQVRYLRI